MDISCPRCNFQVHRGVRILVADDSDQLSGLVAAWLEDEHYDVVTASSGRQTLDAAAVYRADIVLLDLVMPAPGGFEVCAAIAVVRTPRKSS